MYPVSSPLHDEPPVFRFSDINAKNPEVVNLENRSQRDEWLCGNCRPIVDWHYYGHGLPADLRHEFNPDRHCSICRSLTSLVPKESDQARCTFSVDLTTTYAVDRSPAFLVYTKPPDVYWAKWFMLADAGCHAISEFIRDWTHIRDAIHLCRETHAECGIGIGTAPALALGLSVIDCQTNRIVSHPPHEPYICLSYVWGNPSNQPPEGRFPQVVVDATQVIRALGFRYLWVDRYCIPKDDVQRRHNMIAQMDRIYSQSLLTIAASAGLSSEDGLPGVSIPRTQHQTIQTPRYEIVEWYFDEESAIRDSLWSKRAWILQEGLLSPRLLFFTKRQSVLLCNTGTSEELGSCPEKIFRPLSYSHGLRASGSLRMSTNGYRYPLRDLMAHISNFSQREMTYAEDSLNAFLGILGHYNRLEVPIHHIWGLPVYENRPLLEWKHWDPARGSHGSVRPKHDSRRPKAPSWSWSGWAGPVTYDRVSDWPLSGCSYYTDRTFDYTVVASHYPNNLDMEACSKLDKSTEQPTLLLITAPTIVLRLTNSPKTSRRQRIKWYGKANPYLWLGGLCELLDIDDPRFDLEGWDSWGWWSATSPGTPRPFCTQAAVFDISATIAVAADIHMDTAMTLEDGTLGLVLARTGWDDWSSINCGNVAILVLKEVADHYERVGIIYLAGGSLRRRSTIGQDASQVYMDHSGAILDELVLFDNVRYHEPRRPAYPPEVGDPGLPPWIRQTERRGILLG